MLLIRIYCPPDWPVWTQADTQGRRNRGCQGGIEFPNFGLDRTETFFLKLLSIPTGPPNFLTFRHACWHRKGATMIAVAPVCCGCNSIKSNVIPVISNQINDAMRINEPSFWITILHNLILIKKCVMFTDLLLINDSPRATSLTLTYVYQQTAE